MPNEWNIAAKAATWLTEICTARPDLGFDRAEVEVKVKGTNKRHDLTVYDKSGEAVLCGEAKRPENPEGDDPMADALIFDAFNKASLSGVRYFFTWNVNGAVLFDSLENKPLIERRLQPFAVLDPPISSSKQLEGGTRDAEIKRFLTRLLERLYAVTHGGETLQTLPLDELFLKKWEFALQKPVALTNAALIEKFGQAPFTGDLNAWMRDKQNMTLSDFVPARNDNLQRAAKLSCYVLANRILFYKALLRNPAFKGLSQFNIGSEIKTGAQFRALIQTYWKNARRVTGDYETTFGGDDFGDTLPFLSPDAADAWRELSKGTDKFDFTQLGFEVVGQIFERLLSSEERHKFGQHYTRSEVVDLINAFCIRRANATVFDPACGGGTFLVRAYARKKQLAAGTLSHQELLPQLIGNDLSAYPAHLTTINLATRDLIDKANYPFVVQRDFFQLRPDETTFSLPLSGNPNILEDQKIADVDAIVGNPPYIRQEDITKYSGAAYKSALVKQANAVAPAAAFTARSDLFCYFFPHAMEFLKDDGWIGFLVSSSWLDTSYGFRLQKFLLDHFRIVALIESAVEPWFTGARVTTVAVILQRETDAAKRAANRVRFAWVKQPLNTLFGDTDAREDRRQSWFESVRDQIENAVPDETFELPTPTGARVEVGQTSFAGWRVRSIGQGDLETLGLTGALGGDEEDDREEAGESAQPKPKSEAGAAPAYAGSKWGLFLRAPDIFFGLLRAGRGRFAPLGALAEIKRGITSGCDAFFFPRDVTDEVMAALAPAEIKLRYGLSPADTKRLRLVESGKGTRHVIEAKYLEPEVHSLMEINSIGIDPQKLRRQVLLVNQPKEKLAETQVLKYIEWGEEQNFDKGSTCAARGLWYSLTSPRRGDFFMPMAQQYRHIVPFNEKELICNHNLFDAFTYQGVESQLLAALLNSSVVALSKHQYGRLAGREGNLKTEVVDTKMMLVPDPRGASEAAKARLVAAFEQMKTREIGALVKVDEKGPEPSGELAQADRQELDDATLELLGVSDAEERAALRAALYSEIQTLYREIRRAEVEMQGHRNQSNRRDAPTAQSLADEIWESLDAPPAWQRPQAFLDADEPTELYSIEPGKARVKAANLIEGAGVQIGPTFHQTGDLTRASYLEAHAHAQLWGEIEVPTDADSAQTALDQWRAMVAANDKLFAAQASARTVDEKLAARIVSELWKKTRA